MNWPQFQFWAEPCLAMVFLPAIGESAQIVLFLIEPEQYLTHAHNLAYRPDIQHTPHSRIAIVLHKDYATLARYILKSIKTANPAFIILS